MGGLVIHARLNGDRSESIFGGNKRQLKMSLVFRQICNDFRLAMFSTESTKNRRSGNQRCSSQRGLGRTAMVVICRPSEVPRRCLSREANGPMSVRW
jgi:hypothetical protein